MAKRRQKAEGSANNPDKDLLIRIRERFRVMAEADHENRVAALADMKFVNVPGEQWDVAMRKDRGARPCYEFNKLRITCKRVINDMRANRPAGKVRGVEGSDKDTADIYEGLIRNIWNNSDGDTVIDQAAEYQVTGGMGAWRITTKYAAEDAFEQDIVVEPIQNPYCLYADPACQDWLKRDAQDFILTDRIGKDAYKKRWLDAKPVDWEATQFDDESEWDDGETVRIVEYWWLEPYEKELWQLQTGQVIDGGSDEAQFIPPEEIKARRSVICNRVKMCIASGDAVLERADWAGSFLPFIMVYGEAMVVDGKHLWWGLPRFAKDAQRSYNIARTAIAETVAMAPQAKWWATVEQAKGNTQLWAEAHQKNFPFLLYNPDPKAPGPPARMGAADVPVALIQESQMASDEIKSVTGIFDASLGQRSNESSGVAIARRQQQGEIATFNYMDNLSKGIRRTWEIMIDLIPKVYDTERELRILGSDGMEDYARINQVVQDPATGQIIKKNDLATGKYDVTVTVGPSWSTKRQEAADLYIGMTQGNPQLMGIAGDLIMKSLDAPYSEEIAERWQAILPPQIQQQLTEGKKLPPEAQAAMAQATQAMKMVEQQMQVIQQAAGKLQQEQAGVEKGKSEIQVLLARLDAEKAAFEAMTAKQLGTLATQQAKLQVATAEEAAMSQTEKMAGQFSQAVGVIQQSADEFMATAAQVMQAMQKPKILRMEAQRVNGKLIAVPIYADQA